MARPLRIEFSGALYHVTSRSGRQEAIFEDDEDRQIFLRTLAEVVERFNWLCHAYCLMTNHYHLLVETPNGNLSKGMRHLNGVYTQATNRRHSRSGHLFQGRFKGIIVDKDSYLLELTRYVVLNPVRTGTVRQPGKWPWSSYRAMTGKTPAPSWLTTEGILSQFAKRRTTAQKRYSEFVAQGIKKKSIWGELQQQIYLGDEKFIKRVQRKANLKGDESSVPRTQRRPPVPTLAKVAARHRERNDAISAAYATKAYSYREIAEYYGLHLATVGKIIREKM